MKQTLVAISAALALTACATGNTPEAKKKNARKDTADALQSIYKDHPSAKSAVSGSLGYLVCVGSDSYLMAASSGGGVCTFHENGDVTYYRFASLGAGVGIGFKKVADREFHIVVHEYGVRNKVVNRIGGNVPEV